MPLNLYLKGTTTIVTPLTEAQLANLVDFLEEENARDRDYYIDDNVVAYLEEKGCDAQLVAALRRALGTGSTQYREKPIPGTPKPAEGIEVEWREE
jgi:hypothetical protein